MARDDYNIINGMEVKLRNARRTDEWRDVEWKWSWKQEDGMVVRSISPWGGN